MMVGACSLNLNCSSSSVVLQIGKRSWLRNITLIEEFCFTMDLGDCLIGGRSYSCITDSLGCWPNPVLE